MDFFQFLFWIFVAVTFVGFVAYHLRRVRETAAFFRTVAMRYGGRVIDGTPLRWPRLELRHGDLSLALFPVSGGKHSPDRTFVEIGTGLPPDLRLTVQRRGVLARLTRERGLEEISMADPEFDRAFIVQGNTVGAVRGVLTSEARARLVGLQRVKPGLRLNDGRLVLSIDRIPRRRTDFEELISTAIAIAGTAPVGPAERGWRPGDRPARRTDRRRGRQVGAAMALLNTPPVAVAVAGATMVTVVSVIWMAVHAPTSGGRRATETTVTDLADHSYSGYRGRVLGINADGERLRLDDFEGEFLWVDMEGPWCTTSTSQARTIRAITSSRADVTFLTLVTSDREPLSTPDQGSARRWATSHGLPPDRVVAYDSTMTVPHHILYSPTGQTLLRHTGYLPPERVQSILDDQVRRWQMMASTD